MTEAHEIARARHEFREWLRGPSSYLAAVARHELPIGTTLELAGHVIRALPDGFVVDGARCGPRTVDAGRFRLRLSHQNAPAVVVLDSEAPQTAIEPDWFPYDPAFRFVLPLEPDSADVTIGSTREQDRVAERAGWFRFTIDGVACRIAAMRLREPGVAPEALDLYFRDATSGRETYGMGRYLGVIAVRDGRYVVNFNRAYNPACAFSPHYNCPVPPPENLLAVAIRAGERVPRIP